MLKSKMYGERFKDGGDMYDQFNEFLNWSMNYDVSDDKLGSKKETEKWAKKFKCEILYLDGNKPIEEKIEIVLNKISEIKNKRDKIDCKGEI